MSILTTLLDSASTLFPLPFPQQPPPTDDFSDDDIAGII